MKGSLSHELDTGLTAGEVWEVYGTIRLVQLIPKLLPQVLSSVEIIQGDGDEGTIVLVTFPPGTPGVQSYKEQFTKVDNTNYVKEATTVHGGYLDLGFQKYLVRFEITPKEGSNSCVIRSTVEYEIDEEHASNVSFVSCSAYAAIAEAITKHIKENKENKKN